MVKSKTEQESTQDGVQDVVQSNKLTIRIKKLSEDAVVPSYAKLDDAGLDLTAVSMEYNAENDQYIYGTGLAVEIPKGYVGLVYPRSSNRKTDAYMTNHVGVIDSGYRGETMATFKQRDDSRNAIQPPYVTGDRIAQLIVMPYPQVEFVEVEELSETERGEDGHGSTGN